MFFFHIRTQYGSCIQKQTKKLQDYSNKQARLFNHLKFLKRCRNEFIVPKGFRIRITHQQNVVDDNVQRMKRTLEQAIVRKQINTLRSNIANNSKMIENVKTELKSKLLVQDYTWLESIIKISQEKENYKIRMTHLKKYQNLVEERRKKNLEKEIMMNDHLEMKRKLIKTEVVDLTIDGIDADVKEYLALGPDFSEAPTKVPYEQLICETEKMCSIIEKEGREQKKNENEIERENRELREDVKKILENSMKQKVKSNLTSTELKGKHKAMKDKSKVYLPADKGKVMVAMDRYEEKAGPESYEYKMKKVLTDLKAKPSIRGGQDWDLTTKVCRDGAKIIDKILEREEINDAAAQSMKPKNCHAPRLSGYPKVHKDDIPLRGVVSTVGTPFEKLSRMLIPILRSIQGRSGLFVKNSRELK